MHSRCSPRVQSTGEVRSPLQCRAPARGQRPPLLPALALAQTGWPQRRGLAGPQQERRMLLRRHSLARPLCSPALEAACLRHSRAIPVFRSFKPRLARHPTSSQVCLQAVALPGSRTSGLTLKDAWIGFTQRALQGPHAVRCGCHASPREPAEQRNSERGQASEVVHWPALYTQRRTGIACRPAAGWPASPAAAQRPQHRRPHHRCWRSPACSLAPARKAAPRGLANRRASCALRGCTGAGLPGPQAPAYYRRHSLTRCISASSRCRCKCQGCVYPRFSECPQAAGPFAARLRQSQRSLAEAESRGGASACWEHVGEGPGWLAQARVLRTVGPGLWAYGAQWGLGNGPAVARAARAHRGARAGRRQGELVRLGPHGVAEGAVRRRLAAAGPAPGLLVAYCGPW